jgi:hypothetical protein
VDFTHGAQRVCRLCRQPRFPTIGVKHKSKSDKENRDCEPSGRLTKIFLGSTPSCRRIYSLSATHSQINSLLRENQSFIWLGVALRKRWSI